MLLTSLSVFGSSNKQLQTAQYEVHMIPMAESMIEFLEMLSIVFYLRVDIELLLTCWVLILCKLEIGYTKSPISLLLSHLSCRSHFTASPTSLSMPDSSKHADMLTGKGRSPLSLQNNSKLLLHSPSPPATDLSIISQITIPD